MVERFRLDAGVIIDIDVSAADSLKKLHSDLERKGMVLVIARAKMPVQWMLKRCGSIELIGTDHIFPSVRTEV